MDREEARSLLEHADVQMLEVTRHNKHEITVDFRLDVGLNRDTASSLYLVDGEVDELMLRTDPVEPSNFDWVGCDNPSTRVKRDLAAEIQDYMLTVAEVHFAEGEVLSYCRNRTLKPHMRYKPKGEGRDPEVTTRSMGLFQQKVADKFGYDYK